MKVKFDKTTGLVSWEIGDKEISIHFPDLFCAFNHGDQLIMVKEKDKHSNEKFTLYNTEGEFILSYNYLDDKISFKDKVITLDNTHIMDADFDEARNVLIILIKSEEKEF